MKPDVKAKFLRALRSGKYKQGRGWLKNRGRYCCLGVLCEVVGIKPIRREGQWLYEDDATGLPFSAQGRAGIRSRMGDLPRLVMFENKPCVSLMRLNDAGASFGFIADVVEKHL